MKKREGSGATTALLLSLIGLLSSGAPAQNILAKPYMQPAAQATGAAEDAKTVAWVTDVTPGSFSLEYGWEGVLSRTAPIVRVPLDLKAARPDPQKAVAAKPREDDEPEEPAEPEVPHADREQHYLIYRADLPRLPLDTLVWYRVRMGAQVIRDAAFRTRSSPDKTIRFVAVGDLANGKSGQDAIAWQISLDKPDFLLALGDIVYPTGRVSAYMDHFWRTYTNVETPGMKNGAPIMASIPFHVVIGNHDVDTSLNRYPDALGIYYFFRAPANSPGIGKWNTPLARDKADAAAFKAAAGDSYPSLGFYSFDSGPAHFLMLDNSGYVKIDAPEILKWIESDLSASKARWKFVCMHAPMFHSSPAHYTDQKSRALHPLFERLGVDVVFAGHVHNYQRSLPLRFEPAGRKPGEKLISGKYTLDSRFDGADNTRPAGIVHIVSGGGGGSLYKDPTGPKAAELLTKKYGENWAPYTAVHKVDKHSFVTCEVSPGRLQLKAIDQTGTEIDRVIITKP